jgi:transposase-like protein
MRKHMAEHLGGSKVRFTCKTCGRKLTRTQTFGPRGNRKPYPPDMLAKIIRYWNSCGGASMTCRCMQPKTKVNGL